MPIPSDDPTLRKQLESQLNTALRGMRTAKGLITAYVLVTAPVYLVGEFTNPYEPLARGVIGVVLLYTVAFLFNQAVRWDIRNVTDADPEERPTGATGQTLSDVVLGYVFVGAVAAIGGIMLGAWHVATEPGAGATIDQTHFYAGVGLLALAASMAILESYEDYLGVTVQEWLEKRFGEDDEMVKIESVEADDGELVAIGEDDRGESVEVYRVEWDDR